MAEDKKKKATQLVGVKGNENKSFGNHLKRRFIRGLVLIIPILLILFIYIFIFEFVFDLIAPMSELFSDEAEPHWSIHLLTSFLIILLLFFLGLIYTSNKGKKTIEYIERKVFGKFPMYSAVRETIHQFSGFKEVPFSQVVLVDIFGSDTLMTGFIAHNTESKIYTVFVPTAPNPTNGNIYHVPAEKVKFIDVKAEVAMRTIIGMGTGSEELIYNCKEDLLKKLPKDDKAINEDDIIDASEDNPSANN